MEVEFSDSLNVIPYRSGCSSEESMIRPWAREKFLELDGILSFRTETVS
jgi:hypothetical protein